MRTLVLLAAVVALLGIAHGERVQFGAGGFSQRSRSGQGAATTSLSGGNPQAVPQLQRYTYEIEANEECCYEHTPSTAGAARAGHHLCIKGNIGSCEPGSFWWDQQEFGNNRCKKCICSGSGTADCQKVDCKIVPPGRLCPKKLRSELGYTNVKSLHCSPRDLSAACDKAGFPEFLARDERCVYCGKPGTKARIADLQKQI